MTVRAGGTGFTTLISGSVREQGDERPLSIQWIAISRRTKEVPGGY